MKKIVVFTGAGISAESGLKTFRDADGLWAEYRIEDVCTPEALARNRALVVEFYNMRRRELAKCQPNAAHRAVAELERAYILERQKEGIAIAKAKGVYKGRPPKELPDFDRIVTLWQVGEITAVEAARRLQINPSTFYRKLKGVKKQ